VFRIYFANSFQQARKKYIYHSLLSKIGIVLQSISILIRMDSKKEVTHTGIVKEVGKRGIKVEIIVLSGCAACAIKGSCNMAEQSNKKLDIECDPVGFFPNQQVEVRLQASQGFHALFLGYVLPFVLLMAVMIGSSLLTSDEGLIGLVALGSLLPYYFFLYLFRNRYKKK